MKFSRRFEEDWEFYLKNKTKFVFCGENVNWIPDLSKPIVSAKEAFFIYDTSGIKHPTLDERLLIEMIVCKKSVNFHIKMWTDGYDDCLMGIETYLEEFIEPVQWVKKALQKALQKSNMRKKEWSLPK